MLSRPGKEVLIKSVCQAVPSYIMGIFLLSKSLCDDLEKMMNSFWWGKKDGKSSGINWKKWEKMCIPKKNGGVGFRNMLNFNIAMLVK